MAIVQIFNNDKKSHLLSFWKMTFKMEKNVSDS